ncbi:MAG: replicative DNA helicase [Opitutales bacterium]|nr:replicative DNA helicase [Opitutales bacterium]NRA26417.1 replicative DNA helicase [Opitutales bacterium]
MESTDFASRAPAGKRPPRPPSDTPDMSGRTPPHDLVAEAALLGACINDGGRDTMTTCIDARIRPEAFYKPAHQLIYQAMSELYNEGKPFDEIILSEHIRKKGNLEEVGGIHAINQLTENIDGTLYASYYLEIIKEKWIVRRLIRTTSKTLERCFEAQDSVDAFLEEVEQDVFKISQERVTEAAKHIREPIEEVGAQIAALIEGKSSNFGVRSGFKDVDGMTFGFHPTQMIVLAARPSVGKTSLAMNFAEHCVLPDSSSSSEPGACMVFSLEMGADQLAMRLLCCRARVNAKRIRDGFLNSEEQRKLGQAAKELKTAPLYIDDSGGLTIMEMRAKARRLAARVPLKLIVMDYLQLASGSDARAPREQQISEISRGLKSMAKELNVPVIVLSQLNRESEKEKRDPRLSDLRESGSIEQDADVVFLLSRPRGEGEGENGDTGLPGDVEKINLIIAKQRNGPVGEVPLTFVRQYTRYENFTA